MNCEKRKSGDAIIQFTVVACEQRALAPLLQLEEGSPYVMFEHNK